MEKSVKIIDTTLRDGEQAPGVVFSLEEKLRIASLLDKIGVDELEIGYACVTCKDLEDMKTILESGFNFESSAWCRATISDLKMTKMTGIDTVNVSLPVSDIQLAAIGKNKKWVIEEMGKVLTYAKDHFRTVNIGAQDASRADLEFLKHYISYALVNGVSRVRIADTVGILNPISTYELMANLKSNFPGVPFEFHGHNDLGMATGNTVSAISAGTDCISATVNGLGERAGNAAVEEVIAAVKYSLQLPNTYNLSPIQEMCNYVGEAAGTGISDTKPLVGKRTFTHESGIHCKSLIKDSMAYQPFLPSSMGIASEGFVLGKHSGKASVIHFFENQGVNLDDSEAEYLLCSIKELSLQKKRGLNEEELMELYRETKMDLEEMLSEISAERLN